MHGVDEWRPVEGVEPRALRGLQKEHDAHEGRRGNGVQDGAAIHDDRAQLSAPVADDDDGRPASRGFARALNTWTAAATTSHTARRELYLQRITARQILYEEMTERRVCIAKSWSEA
jgi:hypothetical protein